MAPTDVNPEFIEENKKINLAKPSQKFSPWTRSERRKRRSEVYRLHFEKGMPAVRIAEVMKVDRNTIKNDLKILYGKAIKDYSPDELDINFYLEKQLVRLESQRDRLGTYLADSTDVNDKIAIERLIADIDFKLLGSVAKVEFGYLKFWDEVMKRVNSIAEQHKINGRFTSIFELYQISVASGKRLSELRKEIEDRQDSDE